ncbi:MAG: GNAT family N-acetyltransferase [Pseudomonadota bacterium]
MARAIPTINTARLTLRAMRAPDFERYADLWADPAVTDEVGVPVRSRSAAWTSFLRNAGHWQITGFGHWAIEPHRAGALAGQVGFGFAERDFGADFDSYPEAGWMLSPEAQGQGYGREAAGAAHDWFDRVITGPLVCVVAKGNARSLAVALRLGYKELRDSPDGTAHLMFRRSPPQGEMTS